MVIHKESQFGALKPLLQLARPLHSCSWNIQMLFSICTFWV